MVPLAEKYPEQAMSRFESGQFPINAASKMAYVKAASALGRMDQVDIQVRTGVCVLVGVDVAYYSRFPVAIGYIHKYVWMALARLQSLLRGDDFICGLNCHDPWVSQSRDRREYTSIL